MLFKSGFLCKDVMSVEACRAAQMQVKARILFKYMQKHPSEVPQVLDAFWGHSCGFLQRMQHPKALLKITYSKCMLA